MIWCSFQDLCCSKARYHCALSTSWRVEWGHHDESHKENILELVLTIIWLEKKMECLLSIGKARAGKREEAPSWELPGTTDHSPLCRSYIQLLTALPSVAHLSPHCLHSSWRETLLSKLFRTLTLVGKTTIWITDSSLDTVLKPVSWMNACKNSLPPVTR